MLRLLVVFTTVLALISAATQTAAQEEEPCTAVEGALAATPGASPTTYPAGSPTTSPTTEPNGSPTGSPTVTVTTSPVAVERCTVDVVNFAFDPQHISVTVGTTVTWTNMDVGAPHTATADDQDPGTGQPFFDIDLPDQNESGGHTFDTAGEFAYHCDVHPFMTGSVKVT